MLIKNGTIVTASDIFVGDIRTSEGIITEIGALTGKTDELVIDAKGKYVFPGGIDVHTHFDHIGQVDSFETGSKAALAGGITTVGNFVEESNQLDLIDNFKNWKEERTSTSFCDYMLVPVLKGQYIADFLEKAEELQKEGVGVLKLFMAYPKHVTDVDLYRILKTARKHKMLCDIHCENGDVIDYIVQEWVDAGYTDVINHGYTRPCSMEAEAVSRAIYIAEAANAPLRVVHVSCIDALNRIIEGLNHGQKVLAETCPHYLIKDIDVLGLPDFEGAKSVCAPPLREAKHQEALWKAIRNGVITTVSSDHFAVPFSGKGVTKELGRNVWNKIPNGCPGVQEVFSLVYEYGVKQGRISLNQFVQVTSYNAAKEYGVYPKKGSIMPGSDADLVVFDPNKETILTAKHQESSCDYNSYEGTKISGSISLVVLRGSIAVCEGDIVCNSGSGEFVPCGSSSVY